MVCLAPEDHRGHQGSVGEMEPEATLVMLDPEETLDWLGQRETLEDLVLAILEHEDHRVREESVETLDHEAAEETVVRREILELKEPQERQVSQDLLVNQASEDLEESLAETATLVLKETPA